ncbi:hypothetical protein G3M48_004559 [Beauveria asiatica]|uniref:BTB domain-containing protein n=1 Tax=Beauveria asiatica TaxID=1069075 RepID=A0AAW0S934_9HYPO
MPGTLEDQRVADFMTGITQSFCSKQFSDVTIRLGEVELPAHRFVLSTQSEYFKRALARKFEEGDTGIFQYNEGSMHAYWRCFKYIYTGDSDDDELSKDVRVYELAQYFQIQGLKQYALEKFQPKVERLWVSERFVDCIRDVYASTVNKDCKMRQMVVNVTHNHLDELWDKVFEDLLREGGDFVVDVMAQIKPE